MMHGRTYSVSAWVGAFFNYPVGALPWTAGRDCGPVQGWYPRLWVRLKKNLGRLLWTYVRDGRIAQGWTYSVSTSEGACLFDPLGCLPWTGWVHAYLILFHKRGYRRCKSTSVQRRSRSQKSEGFD